MEIRTNTENEFDDFEINKQMANVIIKICFDTAEFYKLYQPDNPNGPQRWFRCNEDIQKGLKWFIGSVNYREMRDKIGAYLNAVEMTLKVYNNMNLLFDNKEGLIMTLNNLRNHLFELQQEIGKFIDK